MTDLDQFEERAAIMEYEGGLPRFRAETLAAQAQGKQRREVMDEISKRDSARRRDSGSAAERDSSGFVSTVQPISEKQERPMPERHVQG